MLLSWGVLGIAPELRTCISSGGALPRLRGRNLGVQCAVAIRESQHLPVEHERSVVACQIKWFTWSHGDKFLAQALPKHKKADTFLSFPKPARFILFIRVRFEKMRFVMVCGWVVLTIVRIQPAFPHRLAPSPFSLLEGFPRLSLSTKQNKTINFL